MFVIYKAICLVNGRAYVGFTSNFLRRKKAHLKAETDCLFHRAIRKYGPDKFVWEILWQGEDGNYGKDVSEPRYIEEHKTFVEDGGYNLTKGGNGVVGRNHTEETKKKIGDANRRRKISERTRRRLSESHKGKMTGKKHPRPMAKITEEDVSIIKFRVKKGESQRQVANAFGIDQAQVSRIVHNKAWCHVKEGDN